MSTDSKLLTLKEVAEKLSVTVTTIRNYIRQGKLQSIKIVRKVYVKESELERFINEAGK